MTQIAFDATQGGMRFRSLVALSLASVAFFAPTALAKEPTPRSRKNQEQVLETFDLKQALVNETEGWTAEDVAHRARGRAPQIASARASYDSASYDAKATWTTLLPQLNMFAQYKRISPVTNNLNFGVEIPPDQAEAMGLKIPNFTQPNDQYNLGVGLVIPVSDIFLRIWPAYEGQLKSAEARKIQIEATEAQVMQQARDAFYNYARAVAFFLVQEQALKQAEAQAAQTKLFVDAGTSAPVDLMQATARVEGARSRVERARGNVEITRTAVATLTGVPRAEINAIREPVTEPPEPVSQSEEQLISSGLTNRPEIRALREAVGATELAQQAENNGKLPRVSLEANDLYANPNPRYVPPQREFHNSWELSATLSWSPNQWLGGSAKANKQAAEERKVRSDLATLEDSIRIEVVQAHQDYIAATATATAAAAELEAAEEAYRVRLATYRVGAGVMQDLIDTDLLVTQARLQHANSTIDARASKARLKRAAALD